MSITCSLGRESFGSGGFVTALIRGDGISPNKTTPPPIPPHSNDDPTSSSASRSSTSSSSTSSKNTNSSPPPSPPISSPISSSSSSTFSSTSTTPTKAREEKNCNQIISVQAIGHVSIDTRWIKTRSGNSNVSNIFSQTVGFSLDTPTTIPNIPGNNSNISSTHQSYCIFVTPRELISEIDLQNDGTYVQFQLPLDVLPTFKGLCIVVSYHIVVTLQSPTTGNIKCVNFPFHVCSGGSEIVPYCVRYSSLAIIPATSLSPDTCFLPLPDAGTYADNNLEDEDILDEEMTMSNANLVKFNIRDEDLVCTLSILLPSSSSSHDPFLKAYPGQHLKIISDFQMAKQSCHTIRARLLQCEKRIDGSRVQDKAICTFTRATKDAVMINLPIQVPSVTTSNFSSPVSEVNHRIELEFYVEAMDPKNKDAISDPQTWSIPVTIIPPKRGLNSYAEMNACLEPALFFNMIPE